MFTTIMLVVGGVIGSGIFRKPGVMAAQVGSPGLLLLVWLVAGVVTLFGALTVAEIAAMIPETGGQYIFFKRIYGPFFAYLYGWGIFAVIQSGSISAVAYVFAEYSTKFFPLPVASPALATWHFHLPWIGDVTPFGDLGVKALAAVLIIALTVVNYVGVALGGVVQNIVTIAKVLPMLLLVALVLFLPGVRDGSNLVTPSTVIHPQGFALVAALAAALQGAFWAYDGWNKLPYVAGEIKNAGRVLPRAMFTGMMIVTGIYLLLNVAYAAVMPVDEMAASKLVAADVAERCFRGGGKWVAAAVMLSTLGAANAIILASARVYYAMARDGVFPSVLGHVHPEFHTPGPSLIAQGVWSCLLLFSGTFDTLTDALIFASWVFYAAAAYGVFVLRHKEPDVVRSFRVPGYPYVPAVFVIFALGFLIVTLVSDINSYRAAVAAGKPALMNSVLGLGLVLIGAPLYLYFGRRSRKPAKQDGQGRIP